MSIPAAKPHEKVIAGDCDPADAPAEGVVLREFVTHRCGAKGMSTVMLTLTPGAELPVDPRPCGAAWTVLAGRALLTVEGRAYELAPFDCLYVPAGVTHRVHNPAQAESLALHRTMADTRDPGGASQTAQSKERLVRCEDSAFYGLAAGTRFIDLFAGRLGSRGICGGYGEFGPGTSLPCHVHAFDESITIVAGEAVCEAAGRRYRMRDYDTAFVPEGLPHRFLNESGGRMAMLWAYAADEPGRTVVDTAYCLETRKGPVDAGVCRTL